jgi:predicted DNA-binding transcriptional regulator AlpA
MDGSAFGPLGAAELIANWRRSQESAVDMGMAPQLLCQTARRPAAVPARSHRVQFITPKDVEKLVSLSRWTVWRLWRAGTFPRPVKVSAGRIAFVAEEVEQWMKARMPAERLTAHFQDRLPVGASPEQRAQRRASAVTGTRGVSAPSRRSSNRRQRRG